MKSLLTLIFLLASFVVFTGCPYQTDVAIDKASVKVDPKLLGTWETRNNPEESYKITRKDEFTYDIEKINKKSSDKKSEKYMAYASTVNGTTFLNLWENNPDGSAPKYFLYKMVMTGDAMFTLSEVTDNIDEQFTSSDELKKFIGVNMKNSYFYNKDETSYIRMTK